MATYILLMRMTQKGRRKMLSDPESMLASAHGISVPNTGVLGLYAVLGEYDFVGIVSAPGNEDRWLSSRCTWASRRVCISRLFQRFP